MFSNLKKTLAMLAAVMAMTGTANAAERPSPLLPTNNTSILLQYGDLVRSGDGRFTFQFQTDGNLVLRQGSTLLWQSTTIERPYSINSGGFVTNFKTHACQTQFQADGNLVILGASGLAAGPNPCIGKDPANMVVMWSSNTYTYVNPKLDVQSDGNVVIYDQNNRARWSTKTCCR